MSRDRARDEGTRSEVLRVLRDASTSLAVAEIAAELGLHHNTARFHLQNLEAARLVERAPGDDPPTGSPRPPGRPSLRYRAVRGMDPAGPRSYDLLALVLLDTLDDDEDSRRRAVDAGRRFGAGHRRPGSDRRQQPDPLAQLVELLDDLGFAPERRQVTGGAQIGLRHCPFLELARDRPHIVCPVHLGLMQGALESWGASVTVERLDAFAEPDRCVAHLAAVAGSPGGAS